MATFLTTGSLLLSPAEKPMNNLHPLEYFSNLDCTKPIKNDSSIQITLSSSTEIRQIYQELIWISQPMVLATIADTSSRAPTVGSRSQAGAHTGCVAATFWRITSPSLYSRWRFPPGSQCASQCLDRAVRCRPPVWSRDSAHHHLATPLLPCVTRSPWPLLHVVSPLQFPFFLTGRLIKSVKVIQKVTVIQCKNRTTNLLMCLY